MADIVARISAAECGNTTPDVVAFILGPLMEEYLRRAMLLSRGNPWVFVQRPISATLLVIAIVALCAKPRAK